MAAASFYRKKTDHNDSAGKTGPAAAGPPVSQPLPDRRRGFLLDLFFRFFFFLFQIVKVLIICGLVFGLAGWGSYFLVQRKIKKTEILVPNIAAYRLEEAVKFLHEEKLDLSLKIENLEYSDLVEEGEIISQFPRSGTFAKPGAVLRVRLSKGSTRVPCPDVRGKNELQAGIDLRNVDLDAGKKTFLPDPDLKRNLVVAQDPPPGTPMNRGDKVHLMVSLGPAGSPFLLPDLKDLTPIEAQDFLRPYGLKIGETVQEPFLGKDDGLIARQEPAPGALVRKGDAVRVFVVNNSSFLNSTAPEPPNHLP